MKLKTWLVLGAALLAAYMAKRSLQRQPEVITLLWALIGLTATSAVPANTAKARSTEDRLAGIIAGVGTVNTAANNAQSTANTANTNAGNAQSTANSAQSTANTANSTANTVNSRTAGLNIPVPRATGLLSAPGSYTVGWGNSVVSFCTQVNNQLQAAGIFV